MKKQGWNRVYLKQGKGGLNVWDSPRVSLKKVLILK
jgi:hypothetical protein